MLGRHQVKLGRRQAAAAFLLVWASPWLTAPTAAAAAGSATVHGTIWYDDNGNGLFDAGEVPAAEVTVSLTSGAAYKYPAHPPPPIEAVSDSQGHVQITYDPNVYSSPVVSTFHAVRPGYPYVPCYPRVPFTAEPHACVPMNYFGGAAVINPTSVAPTVMVPLKPWPGVLDRAASDTPLDYPIPNGQFFRETNGLSGNSAVGFAVTNDDGVPLWTTWQRFGLENIGYPLSQRFVWKGFLTQVFQKAAFQWRPDLGGVAFVNVYDEMHGLSTADRLLFTYRETPFPLLPSFDAGKSWNQIVRDRLALLDANPAIKARYFAAPDPLLLYGLPTSRVEDMGNASVIRTQRAVFQQWKQKTPWAAAGEVTIANGGQIAIDLGIFANAALYPSPPP